ncbi:hypothetical protein HER10_EVM0010037 [Colletotrichum scovillei]|uniref:Uncharacterized protein n=1 Tax=Colletotrichum scovillei TaxID=1209932 RepID=A0A9P7R4R8_9PEZI|nr:uncharacterized protein HER10_EVM0010037 [Colletotrichum scovillei]KAF4774198.1 hypothetical protein HER10_EVM0010037 [Colletotrichum scovillei]KAG7048493.1 hypothetical protein JMJ77_0014130 [Colletotrichum scovillei]KAG7065688.1 hypothetical protein JMJ78_0012435 [Colletotrichum scovillei]KAG7068257.1 hypothetical protein JMJ76_0007947 [Colletotrichum scovillei]
MVKPSKLLPPDPRPWKAEPEKRKERKEFEKEVAGFDWGQAIALGLIGATVAFGIDNSLKRKEAKHEEEDRREERRRQRERQSGSRAPRSSRSQAGYDRDRGRNRERYGRRYDDDDDDGRTDDGRSFRDDRSDRDYYDPDWHEREYKSVRDYAPPPSDVSDARATRGTAVREESISVRGVGGREYVRAVDQFERDYGYGDRRPRYTERRRSQSIPVSRSREYYSNW